MVLKVVEPLLVRLAPTRGDFDDLWRPRLERGVYRPNGRLEASQMLTRVG